MKYKYLGLSALLYLPSATVFAHGGTELIIFAVGGWFITPILILALFFIPIVMIVFPNENIPIKALFSIGAGFVVYLIIAVTGFLPAFVKGVVFSLLMIFT